MEGHEGAADADVFELADDPSGPAAPAQENRDPGGAALAAAEQVDAGLHAGIRRPEQIDSPDYRRAVEPLRRMRLAIPGVRFIYTLVRDGPTIRFILDAADPGDNDGDGVEDRSGIWDMSPNRTMAVQEALGRPGVPGRPAATDEPYTDPWGTFMTGYAPFYDTAGRQAGVAAIDMDASVFVARMATARNQALLGIVPAALVILGLSLVFYRMRLRGLVAVRGVAAAAIEAKNSADDLALERRRLRNVIKGTGAGTWEWNIETGEVLVNERWAEMIGYRLKDLGPVTVDTWKGLLHPDDLQHVLRNLEASFAGTANAYEVDFRMRHAAGHWVWISARGNVIERDPGFRPLRMAGTHQDITARKEVDVALKESEGKFRGLFELSPVGIALNDFRTGRFLEVNEAIVSPTGYTREEFLRLSYWDITPASYAEEEKSQIEAMENSGRYGPYEKEYIRRDGSRYPVLLSGMCMTDAMSDEPDGNLVARFGGDEFVILLNDLHAGTDAGRVAERLLNSLAPVYDVGGRDVHSTASIGIVTSEQCMESAEAVIRNADVAMYEAKRSGRACSVIFNEAMHTRLTRHVTIESGLRKALGTAQLALVYQPIVELETGRMVSAEALLRWDHPTLGPISPAEFIPIA